MALATVIAVMASPDLAHADRIPVTLAPLETLGSQSTVAPEVQRIIARALNQVPDVQLVPASRVKRVLSEKPALRTCHGSARCLADLGRETGARYVVHGEVGGLAEVVIVYLEVIDVERGKELRSTTVELGDSDQASVTRARAGAVKLLAPRRHVGRLQVDVDIAGAAIYIDGTQVGKSPGKPVAVTVGSHALRVTHPEFRDFVRFVDIEFERTSKVEVELQKFPIVTSDMTRDGTSTARPPVTTESSTAASNPSPGIDAGTPWSASAPPSSSPAPSSSVPSATASTPTASSMSTECGARSRGE